MDSKNAQKASAVRGGEYRTRRRKVFTFVKKARGAASVQGFLVVNPVDVRYLTGFTGDDSFLLIAKNHAVLLTDGRYTQQGTEECPGVEIFTRDCPMHKALEKVIRGKKIRKLGIQPLYITLDWQKKLIAEIGKRKLVEIPPIIPNLRTIKDADEIACIRKSVKIAEKAFRTLQNRGVSYWIGKTERQLAAKLDYLMRLGGADKSAFDTIVAVGKNAALPHYRPADCKVKRGDSILIDWGATQNGYCSDLTRVVFAGTIPPLMESVYPVVRAAQRAAIDAIRPGKQCRTIDAVARKIIDDAGHGDAFSHSLGHGLGRDVHEAPGLARSVKTPLRAGMIVTVEPGIYLPDVGGVRIEDDVLVTAGGCEKLSSLSSRMIDMILK
ncbi:MAG: aminopeptidase P family protein [Phycisphaerae bacterium]|nr:aminopeptidase P family protein [Phycisphaerae bacterium]